MNNFAKKSLFGLMLVAVSVQSFAGGTCEDSYQRKIDELSSPYKKNSDEKEKQNIIALGTLALLPVGMTVTVVESSSNYSRQPVVGLSMLGLTLGAMVTEFIIFKNIPYVENPANYEQVLSIYEKAKDTHVEENRRDIRNIFGLDQFKSLGHTEVEKAKIVEFLTDKVAKHIVDGIELGSFCNKQLIRFNQVVSEIKANLSYELMRDSVKE